MWIAVRRSGAIVISRCLADDVYHPAIDVWSAGIIFLFFLTRKFPLFQSNDDVEALMELSTVVGRKGMERTATLHSAYDAFLRAQCLYPTPKVAHFPRTFHRYPQRG